MTLNRAPYLFIVLLGSLLFIPFLGGVHLFDWDEINFAEAAREMLVTGDYARVQIDFQPFWEKPPLFLWMQALSMKLFGVNEFAARFPNAICGILTLFLVFFLGKKYFSAAFGWLWVLIYAGSFLPHFYFKSGIIDPWFNLFIFSGIVFLIEAAETKSLKHFIYSGIAVGLGILTKGPVSLLVIVLTSIVWVSASHLGVQVIRVTKKGSAGSTRLQGWFVFDLRKWLSLKGIAAFTVAMLLTSSVWFAVDYLQNGTFFLREFIHYQVQLFTTGVAGHEGPFYYHLPVLLIGCFPASIFALTGFFNKHDASDKQQDFRLWMIILFLVVLVLFSIVTTKIVHYSSLCYLPLTFLAAWEIHHRIKNGLAFSKWQVGLLAFFGILIGIAAAALPFFGRHPEIILPYIKDAFAKANLEAQAAWRYYLVAFGFIYWLLVLAGIFWVAKGAIKKGTLTIFITTAVLIQASLIAFVPRIERYSQGAAIDFFKTLQGKDVYVEVLGFKSYAHLFYTNKQPQLNPNSHNKDWLLNGAIDKPAYFVCKITKAAEYKSNPNLVEVGRKNGFVFFKREPVF